MRDLFLDNLNQSLVRDLQYRLSTPNLILWIENEAGKLASLDRYSRGFIPFGREVMNERCILAVERQTGLSGLGSLKATEDGFYIYFSAFLSEYDSRFAIAHELGHTFWRERHWPWSPLSAHQERTHADPTIEKLCSLFASSFLISSSDIKNLVQESVSIGDLLKQVPSISKRTGSPERLTARRLFFESNKIPSLIICLRRPNPVLGTSAEKIQSIDWRVVWAAIPDGIKPYLRKIEGLRIPHEFFEQMSEVTGISCGAEIDERVWGACLTRKSDVRRKGLTVSQISGRRLGYMYKSGQEIYIALPIDISIDLKGWPVEFECN